VTALLDPVAVDARRVAGARRWLFLRCRLVP
jgi:hypothetical protein